MSSETVVEVAELRKSYGDVQALKGIDFTIPAGAVVGLLGPNGAGKTTAMKILTGYLAADHGTVRVCGHDVASEPLEVKRRVGYLPENNPLYLEQRVADFLAFACRAREVQRGDRHSAIDRVVAETGLEPVFRRPIGECSKGFRQRVGLAQALLHDPPLLVLDEPTSGLDPIQVVEIRDLVRELGVTKTVILTSHVLPEVEALAERVILVHCGEKVADAPLEELRGSASGLRVVRFAIRGSREELAALAEDCDAELLVALPAPFGEEDCAAAELRLASGSAALQRLSEQAAARGLPILELSPRQDDLESVFRRLAGAEPAAAAQEQPA